MSKVKPFDETLLVPDPLLLERQISPPLWDLYTATGRDGITHDAFLEIVEAALGSVTKVRASNCEFYAHRLNLIKDARTIGHVAWGGHNAIYPKLEVTGRITQPVVDVLQARLEGRYGVPDFHSCVDFSGGRDTFVRLQRLAEKVQMMPVRGKKPRLVARYDAAFPEDPWAFEFGSKKATYVNVYEKGRESPEQYDVDTVRAELRSRFPSAGKLMVGMLDANEAWGVAAFTHRMARMLFDPNISRQQCRVVKQKTPAEESIANAGMQYNKAVLTYMRSGHSTTDLGDLIYSAALMKQAIQNAKKGPYPLGGTNTQASPDVVLEGA